MRNKTNDSVDLIKRKTDLLVNHTLLLWLGISITIAKAATVGALTVGGDVDLIWKLTDVHLEAVLHIVQGAGVTFVRHKSDSQSFGAKPACPGNLTRGAGLLTKANAYWNIVTCSIFSYGKRFTADAPCVSMCLSPLACRSWRLCWRALYPSPGQTSWWPPGSAAGSPWTAGSETVWGGWRKEAWMTFTLPYTHSPVY